MSIVLLITVLLLAASNRASDNFRGVAALCGSRTVGYRVAPGGASVTTMAGSPGSLWLGACRALVVEAKIRLWEDRFLAICGSIVVLWIKNRRKYGPNRRICRPANQSPTGS
jgi:phosphate/sulfate permease